MNYLQSILVGILFGIWPLFMNRSGLGPHVSMLLYCVAGCAVVALGMIVSKSPFTIGSSVQWTMFLAASAIGGIGLFLFGGIIANSAPSELTRQMAIVTVLSILTPFLYYMWNGAEVDIKKVLGFVLSVAGVYLLVSR